jgi:hypothetical protein
MGFSAAMHPTLPEGFGNRSLEPGSLEIPVGMAGIPKMIPSLISVAGEIRPPQVGDMVCGRRLDDRQPLPSPCTGRLSETESRASHKGDGRPDLHPAVPDLRGLRMGEQAMATLTGQRRLHTRQAGLAGAFNLRERREQGARSGAGSFEPKALAGGREEARADLKAGDARRWTVAQDSRLAAPR